MFNSKLKRQLKVYEQEIQTYKNQIEVYTSQLRNEYEDEPCAIDFESMVRANQIPYVVVRDDDETTVIGVFDTTLNNKHSIYSVKCNSQTHKLIVKDFLIFVKQQAAQGK